MLKKLLPMLVGTFLCFAILNLANAGNPNDEDCAGELGAAYGFCVAASHLGCGTGAEQNEKACIKIENNYIQITGEDPPWLIQCPCGDAQSILDMYANVATVLCEYTPDNFFGIRADNGMYGFYVQYPNSPKIAACYSLGGVGYHHYLTDGELRKCASVTRTAANGLGISCTIKD